MTDREQAGAGERPEDQDARRQGDGDDSERTQEIGRVGESDRGGQGGYGADTGFAGGTTGSQEGLRAGQGSSSQSPTGRSNDGGAS